MYAIGEEIEIVIFRFGEKVVHRFKDPDEKEWLAIARDFAALRSKSGDEEAQRALLIEYDRRVVSVGGYTLDGVDVMQARATDWRDFIPPEHKAEVITKYNALAILKRHDVDGLPC